MQQESLILRIFRNISSPLTDVVYEKCEENDAKLKKITSEDKGSGGRNIKG